MGFLKFVGYIISAVLLILAGAGTLMTLWGWFVVPLGVTSITLAHAAGLSLMVSYFAHRNINSEPKGDYFEKLGKAYGLMVMTIGLGYVITQFM